MNSQLEKEFVSMLKENKEDFYKLAYSYVKNEYDALDIISESTYKGLQNLHKLKEKRYMKTWFYRIVINESVSFNRKNKRIIYDSRLLDSHTDGGMGREEQMDLHNAIDDLPSKYKTVIILKYMKGLSIRDIAEIVNIKENTVKTRLNRGVAKLKAKM